MMTSVEPLSIAYTRVVVFIALWLVRCAKRGEKNDIKKQDDVYAN